MLAAATDAQLEGRLFVEPLEDGRSDAIDGEPLCTTEFGERTDTGSLEQIPLAPGDVGDQAEMVIFEALLVAGTAPATDLAVS